MDGGAANQWMLEWCLHQPAVPYRKLQESRPNYLVISPPKTGSTWLAENFRHHPDLFVSRPKEIKYFSSLYKWAGLDYYLDLFGGAAGRVKGEASPSYAILPVERIRLVRALMPDVKLIFLMRDPVGRAWSHARHNYRYREGNFEGFEGEFEDISDRQWLENFAHSWPLASGDYLGQLRRWLSVFPREQFFLGFYEEIARRPEELLRDLFTFLGVRTDVDYTRLPARQRILPGIDEPLPGRLEAPLHRLLGGRTRELAGNLTELGLKPPPEWDGTLRAAESAEEEPEPFIRAGDDDYLAEVLRQEETFASSWRALKFDRGHHLLLDRGRLYAADEGLGPVKLAELDAATLDGHLRTGRMFWAHSTAEADRRIDITMHEQARQDRDEFRQQLQDARDRLGRLEETVTEVVVALHHAQATIELLCVPWHRRLMRFAGRLAARVAGLLSHVLSSSGAGGTPAERLVSE